MLAFHRVGCIMGAYITASTLSHFLLPNKIGLAGENLLCVERLYRLILAGESPDEREPASFGVDFSWLGCIIQELSGTQDTGSC